MRKKQNVSWKKRKKRQEIQFKYADEIQEMTEVAQNIREIEEKEGRFKCGA